jgi:hypothetical protein
MERDWNSCRLFPQSPSRSEAYPAETQNLFPLKGYWRSQPSYNINVNFRFREHFRYDRIRITKAQPPIPLIRISRQLQIGPRATGPGSDSKFYGVIAVVVCALPGPDWIPRFIELNRVSEPRTRNSSDMQNDTRSEDRMKNSMKSVMRFLSSGSCILEKISPYREIGQRVLKIWLIGNFRTGFHETDEPGQRWGPQHRRLLLLSDWKSFERSFTTKMLPYQARRHRKWFLWDWCESLRSHQDPRLHTIAINSPD